MNNYFDISAFDFTIRLAVSIACGFIIGFERQWHNRIAGVQTNILVSAGACLFVLSSLFMTHEGQSASRIAAQIVSGIGFLGAGMIFKDGFTAHGINTAATVWCVAAIGVIVGIGEVYLGIISTIFVTVMNMSFRRIDNKISKHRKHLDKRVVKNYMVQVTAPNEDYIDLRSKIIDIIDGNDKNVVFAVRTDLKKKDYAHISVSFTTYDVSAPWIRDMTKKVQDIDDNLIVDWAEIKN